MRINVSSGTPYSIPANNPFWGVAGARKEVWARGVRNPWRISFDRLTGDLYIADVGQNEWEELNFHRAGTAAGENFGWRKMEGARCFNPQSNCNDGTLRMPFFAYSHSSGGCSVTGGYVYRGSKIPAIYGTYLFADFCSGVISGAKRVNGRWTVTPLLGTGRRISTFGEDRFGTLYVAQHGATDGAIYRIIKR